MIGETNRATSNCTADYHERYLKVVNLIMERNDKMAWAFDDMGRSNAILLPANIREEGLINDDEFSQFSPKTREAVETINEIRRR